MKRPIDRICFIFGKLNDPNITSRQKHEDWTNRHNLVYDNDQMWHIASLAVNSRMEKLIAGIPKPDRCPVSTKRWIMHKFRGQDTEQLFVEYSKIGQVVLPHGRFCPHCLEMAERAAKMLSTERNETVPETTEATDSTRRLYPGQSFAADRPFIVDSANGQIHFDKERITITAAKKLATKLVQQHDRPFTVCVPHTTLSPKARPVKETKHRAAAK